jgi:hypothetical protein
MDLVKDILVASENPSGTDWHAMIASSDPDTVRASRLAGDLFAIGRRGFPTSFQKKR